MKFYVVCFCLGSAIIPSAMSIFSSPTHSCYSEAEPFTTITASELKQYILLVFRMEMVCNRRGEKDKMNLDFCDSC